MFTDVLRFEEMHQCINGRSRCAKMGSSIEVWADMGSYRVRRGRGNRVTGTASARLLLFAARFRRNL